MAGDDTLHVHRGLDLPLSEISWRATTSGGMPVPVSVIASITYCPGSTSACAAA